MYRTATQLIITAACLAGAAGAADLQYVERTQMTGGALVRMTSIPMMGRLTKGLTDPVTTTHSYAGNKKASVSAKHQEIWDLDTETITSIDLDDKQYSVITFAEMAQATAKMAERMSQQQAPKNPGNNQSVNAKWKASFDKNGQTKQVAGVAANGGTMKLELEGTDAKTGQTGSMKVDLDLWMGRLPGWEVKQAFDRRAGEKLSTQVMPQMQAVFLQAGPAAIEAMQEAGRKMAELGDMQLASVTKMYSDSIPATPEGPAQTRSQESGPTVGQIAKEEATREAEYEAARRAGGRIGGLGGRLGGRLGQLGRKPKEPAPQQQQPPAPPAQTGQPAAAGPGLLLEMTTEVVSYSSSVDASAFVVPAGFKKVEHPMKKALAK